MAVENIRSGTRRSHPLPASGERVMMLRAKNALISSFAIEEETCNAGNGRRTGAGAIRRFAIGLTFSKASRDIKSFTPGKELRERPDVPEQIRYLFLGL